MKKHNAYPVFRNYIAMFGWVFVLLWMSGLLAFTHLYLDKGIPGTHPLVAAGIMLFFWVGGLAASAHVFSQPCVRGEVRNGALFVKSWTPRTLLRPRLYRFDLFGPPPAFEIVHDTDSDGDPYFRLTITTPDGGRIAVAEGHHLEDIEARRADMLELWRWV